MIKSYLFHQSLYNVIRKLTFETIIHIFGRKEKLFSKRINLYMKRRVEIDVLEVLMNKHLKPYVQVYFITDMATIWARLFHS